MMIGRLGPWSIARWSIPLSIVVAGVAGVAGALVGGGCSSTRGQPGADGSAALTACAWPSSFDRTDGAADQCVAARMYLACTAADGSGEACLSDDPTQCPGPERVVGTTFGNCRNLCLPNEYAVACGGVGPDRSVPLPAACRGLPPNPGGVAIGCCPCGVDLQPSDAAGDVQVGPSDSGDNFDCGGTITCDAGSQVCQHVSGGVPPGGDRSCACVTTALRGRGVAACSAAGPHLTVQIAVP